MSRVNREGDTEGFFLFVILERSEESGVGHIPAIAFIYLILYNFSVF
jgi:hypothetical protein